MSETATEETVAAINETPDDDPFEEPVEDEDEDEPEDSARQPDEVTSPQTEKEMERLVARLLAEAARHKSRIREIMGGDADALIACELCLAEIPGYLWQDEYDDEKRALVLAAIGMGALGELVADEEAQACDRCHALGVTLTGSRVDGQTTRPCSKCAAKGWTSPDDRRTWESTQSARQAVAEMTAPSAAAPVAEHELPPFDAWTRPRGHHFYGRNPMYMTGAERSADWEGAR